VAGLRSDRRHCVVESVAGEGMQQSFQQSITNVNFSEVNR
jgi:hypothetical protein